MKLMSAAAVERAMAKRITWFQAAEILGISCRQMQRWKTRFEHEGYEGLFDRRRGAAWPRCCGAVVAFAPSMWWTTSVASDWRWKWIQPARTGDRENKWNG